MYIISMTSTQYMALKCLLKALNVFFFKYFGIMCGWKLVSDWGWTRLFLSALPCVFELHNLEATLKSRFLDYIIQNTIF